MGEILEANELLQDSRRLGLGSHNTRFLVAFESQKILLESIEIVLKFVLSTVSMEMGNVELALNLSVFG